MTDRTSVLVVGAGPAGMAAAAMLRRQGVSVRIVDAAAGVATGSRAIMLWPPAQEALRSLGLLDALARKSDRPRAFAYHTGPSRTLRVKIAEEFAPLVIQQQTPGELLDAELERLGAPVERQVTVVEVTEDDTTVTARTRHADGTEDEIQADWLIAADGVRSTVRDRLGIGFEGTDDDQRFLLAEGRLDGEIDREVVHYVLGQAGVMLFAPLPGGTTRVSTPVEEADATPELLNRMIAERGMDGVRMPEPDTLTTFTSAERIAERLRHGRCFLIGDAAHVHSAIGGQGLALGLEDARNLTWKLAGVVDGRLGPAVLDTYEPERRAAIEHVVQITGRMSRQAVLSPAAVRMRNGTLRTLHALGVLERVNVPMLAGRRAAYPGVLFGASPLPEGGRRAPKPGRRAPEWVPIATGEEFLLVTTGSATGECAVAADTAATKHPLLGHVHVKRPGDGVLLVRPDGFVAAAGRGPAEVAAIESLMTSLAGPAEPATPAEPAAPVA